MATVNANIRWADNTQELKANLLAGIGTLDAMKSSVDRTVASLSGNGLFQAANKTAAAIDQMGGITKLTAAEQDRANTLIDKAIEKYQLMGMTVPTAMLQIQEALHNAAAAGNESGDAMQRQTDLLPGFISKYLEARTIYDLAKDSYGAFTGLLSTSIEAYGSAEQAEARLAGGLQAVGSVTPGLIDQYTQYADALARTTTISKTAALEAEGTFTLIGNVGPESMQRALQATADFSAVTGKSFNDAAMAIAKATDGNVGQLKRYGVQIDAATVQSEGIGAVFDAIETKMNGQAQIIAGTLIGQWQQIGNEWEVAKEHLGADLAPALIVAGGALKTLVDVIADSPGTFLLLVGASTALAGSMAWMAVSSVYGDQLARLAGIVGGELTTNVTMFSASSMAADGSVLGLAAAETTLSESSVVASGSVLGLSGAEDAAAVAAGGAATSMTALSAALPVVAVAALSVIIGEFIGKVTGATDAIQRWADGNAKVSEHAAALAMQQDTINKAITLGAPANIAYGDALAYVQDKLKGAAVATNAHQIVTDALAKATATVSKELANIPAADVATMMQELHDKTAISTSAFEEQAKKMGLSATTIQFLKDQVKAHDDATKNATKSTTDWDASVQALADTFTSAKLDVEVAKLDAAVGLLGGSSDLTAKQILAIGAAAQKLKDQGGELTPELGTINTQFNLMVGTSKALAAMGPAIKSIPVAAGFEDDSWATRMTLASRNLSGIQVGLIDTSETAKVAANDMATFGQAGIDWTKAFEGEVGKAGDTILTAFAQGGNVGNALQKGASDLGAVGGDMMMNGITNSLWSSGNSGLASTFDKLAPGLGGAVVTLGMDLGKKLWNSLFGDAGRQAVVAFAQTFADPGMDNGFANLQKKLQDSSTALQLAGYDSQQLWVMLTQGTGSNNPAQAAANIAKVTKALSDADAASTAFNGTLNPLLTQLQTLGGTLSSQLVDALTKTGLLTSQNAALLQGMADTGGPSLKQLTDLQTKYNLTTAQMGPAFQQANDTAGWQSIIDDLKTATDGGLDMNGVLAGMSPTISKLVQDSLQFNTTIPGNMEATVKSLAAQGLLLDTNGQKITDTSKLTFGDDLQSSVDKLVLSIQALVDSLTTKVPAAAQAAARGMNDAYNSVKPPPFPQMPDYGDTGGSVSTAATGGYVGKNNILHFASGGRVPFGTDTVPAMLTPGEIILNSVQQRSMAGAMGGQMPISITVNAPGATRDDADAIADRVEAVLMERLRREKRLNAA